MWKPANPPNTQKPANSPANTQRPTHTETEKPAMTSATPLNNASTTNDINPAAAPRNAALNPQEQASIGKSLVIKGEVSGSESLYIDGRVEGSINLPGNRLTVGRNGVVSANVTAREIVVIGKLRGNVMASDRVDIRNEGSLTGDVVAQRISIEDGAYFKGGIDIRKPGQKDGQANGKMDANHVDAKEPIAARA
jgi:cytoskeletal protein CcmA (bactofilin family)